MQELYSCSAKLAWHLKQHQWEYPPLHVIMALNFRPRTSFFNIDHSEGPIVAGSRTRVAKAPKPLPYLTPVTSFSREEQDQPEGGARKVRVRFVNSVQLGRFLDDKDRVVRTQSEHSLSHRQNELAYLIVDLESGKPINLRSKSSGKH